MPVESLSQLTAIKVYLNMSSKVKIIPKSELHSMPTGPLVRRRTDLLKCEESFESSDRYGYEEPPEPHINGFIEFKDQPCWSKAYKEVKDILADREHLPTAAERKARRKAQGKKKH